MRTEVVTSFSPEMADLGRQCVASVRAYWPHPLMVYTDALMGLDTPVRLTAEIPGWRETRASLPASRPDAAQTGTDHWTRKPTSYLWNAQRFAVKPFVWLDAAELLERGFLVWLDADTLTTAEVPDGLIADLMRGVDVAYLGRGSMHPETGLVIFRVPEALPLLRWCCEAYMRGWFRALADGWTDCHLLRAALTLPVRSRDLTSHRMEDWRSSVDAMALSPFGPYVQHWKGTQRKRGGLAA